MLCREAWHQDGVVHPGTRVYSLDITVATSKHLIRFGSTAIFSAEFLKVSSETPFPAPTPPSPSFFFFFPQELLSLGFVGQTAAPQVEWIH